MLSKTEEHKMRFDNQVLKELKPKDSIFVGFSGGADSTALLYYMVKKLRMKNITAIHVNHGISSNSDEWEKICHDFCKSLGVKFFSVKISEKIEKNIECVARNFRLRIFSQFSDHIVLAHHRDDVVENFFLSLMRKKTPSNYKIRKISNVRIDSGFLTIYRPFIDVTRKEILDFCAKNNLSFIHDSSNDDIEKYERNWFRFFLKKADERFDNFSGAVAASLEIIDDLVRISNDLAEIDLKNYFCNEAFDIEKIRKDNISLARFKNMVIFLMLKRNISYDKNFIIFLSYVYRKYNVLHFEELKLKSKNNKDTVKK